MPDSAPVGVLLLRGVNVGANRALPMADLRAILSDLGLTEIRTHIQSGNAVFRAPGGLDGLAERVAASIGARFPFTPAAMVLPADALTAILSDNPFAEAGRADGSKVHIGILAHPVTADPAALRALAAPDERFHLTDAAFYLHAPSGIGRAKLAARAEALLKVPMTMRNQRVAEAIAALAQAPVTRGLPC